MGSDDMTYSSVYITAPTEAEAVMIAKTLIAERLAACANIFDSVRSIYRWAGEVQDDAETVLILKTRAELLDALIKRAVELHSDDVPCVVSWAIQDGNEKYLDWIQAETNAVQQ
tara:strand:+ start:52 stop:393 length:342 start_codon:yes stop_codon:yes gene_type:complete